MTDLPQVNFGQSNFQDTYFNTLQQSTPYRQLRQILLEISQIESAIKKHEFSNRRSAVKLANLKALPLDELTKIDIEETEWDNAQQVQLLYDANNRLTNFIAQRDALLAIVPKEYWDQGFEAAESQYWVNHLTKQLTISKLSGMPNLQAIDMIMALPAPLQEQIMIDAHKQSFLHVTNIQEKLKQIEE